MSNSNFMKTQPPVKVVKLIGQQPYKLETFAIGETGSPTEPRPKALPLGQNGIAVYSEEVTPTDIVADVYSHIDKNVPTYRKALIGTLTKRQQKELARQYRDYQITIDEASPNADSRAINNAVSGLLRTSTFGQGGPAAVNGLNEFKFNVEQKNILGNAKNYAYTGTPHIGLGSLKKYLEAGD